MIVFSDPIQNEPPRSENWGRRENRHTTSQDGHHAISRMSMEGCTMSRRRSPALTLASFAVVSTAAWVGLQRDPALEVRLEVVSIRRDTGQNVPSRVYLFKDGRPFRLSPVDAMLPLRVDSFYRERLWRQAGERPRTLEVSLDGESHFILLDGRGVYELPAGKYRLEAHCGLSLAPASVEFSLAAGERRRIELNLEPVAGAGRGPWLSGDDHIHLTRFPPDDDVFLRWLQAEDLSVANFLQLQRQVDAAPQYGFGRKAEARAPGFSIRSGHESRSEFYGHVNLLGPEELIRPLSIGKVYANSADAYPFPNVLFRQGRRLGATVGYAHFDGSMDHSTLPMDLALGSIDFVEVFQFGELKMGRWYEVLDAGFRVTGVAGSDFPANLPRFKPWPRAIPLLGPERTLVRGQPDDQRSTYERWSEGVRKGAVIVSNGPLLDLAIDGKGPGEVVDWDGASTEVRAVVEAAFSRPIEALELVVNGRVVATQTGDSERHVLSLTAAIPLRASAWVAARARGRRHEGEPERWAHTNPVYVLRARTPVYVPEARSAILGRWLRDVAYYRSDVLTFANLEHRQELLTRLEEATRILERRPLPWR
jgi:hypothetical protein